jgi:hypothetical protein
MWDMSAEDNTQTKIAWMCPQCRKKNKLEFAEFGSVKSKCDHMGDCTGDHGGDRPVNHCRTRMGRSGQVRGQTAAEAAGA